MKRRALSAFRRFIAISLSVFFVIALTGCGAPQKSGLAIFEGQQPAAESDFEYGDASDGEGIMIVDYKGSNSVLIIPETIEGKPVTEVGMGIFDSSLTTEVTAVKFPSGIKTIPMQCFDSNKNILVVDASHAEVIDTGAFGGCKKLETLKLGDSLKELRGLSIFDCPMLKEVYVSPSMQTIEDVNLDDGKEGQDVFLDMSPDFTITGKAGSFIEEWTKEYGINFKTV